MSSPVGLGVIGSTSTVARLAVLPAIERSSACSLVATASRSDAGATYPSYEALLEDPAVEAVYIPLPNSLHREWTERAAAAGKHVLCEKPLAPTAGDALAMAEACEAAGVRLMEAYMTQFHPRDRRLRQLVASGMLGEVIFASAAFTGVLDRPDDHRWHPGMGGGALLDVGIYCLSPLLAAFGVGPREADSVEAVAASLRPGGSGVDASFSGWLGFGGGRAASFQCSFEAPERQQLELVGTSAALLLERPFTPGPDDRSIRLLRRDGSGEALSTEGADPYLAMVDHFAALVRGRAEPERPPEDSVGLQRLVDRLLASASPSQRDGAR
ncbi:MAG TPA: Gfo/Idh/MocA family oxidoreductase [Acidimicrobiales bacterium]|nr:Gfo/Idh/MocA family oxidoreductase [Acidimicrobiales bacterium]